MMGLFKDRAPQPLGPLEVTVMEILWARGESNVRDVVDRLDRPLAYTTVMTTLDRLFKKGLLARRKSDRAFIYAPSLTRDEWEHKRAGDFVAGFLSVAVPSRDLLISCLVEAVGRHDELLLDELERKSNCAARSSPGGPSNDGALPAPPALSLSGRLFVVHCVVRPVVALTGPAAVRAARRMRPRSAGRFLLVLRLLPAALAQFVFVAGLCVPSYLWLEPEINAEEVGAACLAAAVLAAVLLTISTARGIRAAARSARHARDCARLGRLATLPGSPLPVCILDAPEPVFSHSSESSLRASYFRVR